MKVVCVEAVEITRDRGLLGPTREAERACRDVGMYWRVAEVRSSSVVAGLDWGVRWVSGERGTEKERVVENGEPFDSSEVWKLESQEGFIKTCHFRRFQIDSVPDCCGRCEDVEGWVTPSPCGVPRADGRQWDELGTSAAFKARK